MTRRVGLHLRAVQSQPADFQQSRFTTQGQDFQEQRLHVPEMSATEFADPLEVWNIFPHNHSKRHVCLAASHDLARRKHPHAVRIQQQHQHHPRVERRLAAFFAVVVIHDRRDVNLFRDFQQEVDQMILRQPIVRRRRKQVILIRRPFPKFPSHPCQKNSSVKIC